MSETEWGKAVNQRANEAASLKRKFDIAEKQVTDLSSARLAYYGLLLHHAAEIALDIQCDDVFPDRIEDITPISFAEFCKAHSIECKYPEPVKA
jgi:hypothetical protein